MGEWWGTAYSDVIELTSPHAIEKTVNMMSASRSMVLWPNMLLSFE